MTHIFSIKTQTTSASTNYHYYYLIKPKIFFVSIFSSIIMSSSESDSETGTGAPDKSSLPAVKKSKRQNFPHDKKVQILTKIRASNSLLIGPFTNDITPRLRNEEELRLLSFCLQIGAPNIDSVGAMYKIFNGWKKNLKEMMARRKNKTGIGRQRKIKEADEILYAIIKENPAIDTLKVSVYLPSLISLLCATDFKKQ